MLCCKYQKDMIVKTMEVVTTTRDSQRDVSVWSSLMSSTPRYTATNCFGSESRIARKNLAGWGPSV